MSLTTYVFFILTQVQQPGQAPAQTPQTPATKPPVVTPAPVVQTPVTQAPVAQAVTPQARLAAPFLVADPTRLAMTPTIDGKIDDEEWDPLGTMADGSKAYFEWEPGKLHAAAVVPNGHDALFSFDLDSNGWLKGKDNLELRVSFASGKPTVTVRVLDATNGNGPTWLTFPGIELAATVAATSDAANTTYELTFADPGLGILPGDPGDAIGIRVDDPLSTDPPFEPYLPRLMTPVTLSYHRSAGLPAGVQFRVENEGRYFVGGERGRIRLLFNGSNDAKLQRLELHTEGPAKNDTNMLAVPFPTFDAKGRCFVDFDTGIRPTALIGFRVLKGTLTAGDGVSAILETSFRVAPPVDFTLVTQPIKIAPTDRSIRLAFYVHSNSGRPLGGNVTVNVPMPLKLVNTTTWKLEVPTGRGRLRETYELYVPGNTVGTFAVHLTGDISGKPFDQIGFITIGGS